MSKLWRIFNGVLVLGISAGQLLAFTPGAGSQTSTVERQPLIPERAGMHFANLPSGLELPIKLTAAVDPASATIGDTIVTTTTRDVLINGDTLPEGSKVFGHIGNDGQDKIVSFDRLELSTGTVIPISTAISRGLPAASDSLVLTSGKPVAKGMHLVLKLKQRAQIATNGNIL